MKERERLVFIYQIEQKSEDFVFFSFLPHSSGFSLGFQKSQNIAFSDWSFDVSEDASVGFVAKLNSYLDTLTLRSGSAEHFSDFGESWLISFWVHVLEFFFRFFLKKQNKSRKIISFSMNFNKFCIIFNATFSLDSYLNLSPLPTVSLQTL